MDSRIFAAKLVANVLRTGEAAAIRRLRQMLASDVSLARGAAQFNGVEAVTGALTGQWPMTDAYARAVWSAPLIHHDRVEMHGTFEQTGASPDAVALVVQVDDKTHITHIDQQITPFAPAEITDALPDIVRSLVDGALANGTPMAFACSGEQGEPLLTVRGSVQAFDSNRLSLWMRNAEGGGVRAIRANPRVALLYRDSRMRTTLAFDGLARIVTDQQLAAQIFDLMPEVEQTHDLARKGLAVIVDVTRLSGFTPAGQVRMQRRP